MNDEVPVAAWRLENDDPAVLEQHLAAVATFADWLRGNDIDVPLCWYTHGWIRHRLAAMFEWYAVAADAKEAASWWADLQTLVASDAWRVTLDHGQMHVDAETGVRARYASFEETVEELCPQTVAADGGEVDGVVEPAEGVA